MRSIGDGRCRIRYLACHAGRKRSQNFDFAKIPIRIFRGTSFCLSFLSKHFSPRSFDTLEDDRRKMRSEESWQKDACLRMTDWDFCFAQADTRDDGTSHPDRRERRSLQKIVCACSGRSLLAVRRRSRQDDTCGKDGRGIRECPSRMTLVDKTGGAFVKSPCE